MATTSRSRRWWIRGVVLVVALGVVVSLCWPAAPLTPHTGDGEFTDLSWSAKVVWVPVFNVRGYAVSMPSFDLGQDHAASYRVSQLPEIGRDCTLYLAIRDPEHRWTFRDREINNLRGSVRLEVVDERGEVIRQSEGPLRDHIWSLNSRTPVHRLYHKEAWALSFPARAAEEYVLRITYKAEPALAGYEGFCYLECGGR